MSEETAPTEESSSQPHRHWYRLALLATLLTVAVVIAMLPLAVTSMQEVQGRGSDTLYDLVAGQPVDPVANLLLVR
jgi:hypothetical protein